MSEYSADIYKHKTRYEYVAVANGAPLPSVLDGQESQWDFWKRVNLVEGKPLIGISYEAVSDIEETGYYSFHIVTGWFETVLSDDKP